MSLRYKLHRAHRLLAQLDPDERSRLARVCAGIRQAQEALLAKAEPAMHQCLHNCEGLCCRNARMDDIIGLWDLVYILAVTPALEPDMQSRVRKEKPFFSADCMFLAGRMGPCIFPSGVRPEVCITTFCSGDAGIQKEIRAVRRQFWKLHWFFMGRRPRHLFTTLQRRLRSGRSPSSAAPSGSDAGRRS
jgi:hypothetical protein